MGDKIMPKAVKRAYVIDCNELPSSKKPKTDPNPLQLVDINDDCLRSIFYHLDLEGLVNIAEISTRFAPIAQSLFSRYYRNQKFMFSSYLVASDENIPIKMDLAAPLLHHFGHCIIDLMIDCLRQNQCVGKLIQTHCAGSLVSLKLLDATTNLSQTICNSFEKLSALSIVRGKLGLTMLKCFPNLTTLELINVEMYQPNAIHFPALKRLVIHNDKKYLLDSTIVEMFRLNSQVEVLHLRQIDYDANLIQSIGKHLTSLEELVMWLPTDRFLSTENQKFLFNSVKRLALSTFYNQAELVESMPFRFQQLQTLTLDGFHKIQDHLLNFIMENRTLTKLRLVPYIDDFWTPLDDMKIEDLLKITKALPQLTELEFYADAFTHIDLVSFLADSKMLKKVRLLFIDLPYCPRFRAQLNMHWNVFESCKEKECIDEQAFHFCLVRKH